MNDGAMHETIRGLYRGVLEPQAWQRSLHALCELSGSVQASLLILDTEQNTVYVRQTVDRTPENRTASPSPFDRMQNGLPFAHKLPIGAWHIDRYKAACAIAMQDAYGDESSMEVGAASIMACLVDRTPSQEIYLTLHRPSGREGYSEGDARALDWIIPHLREAITLNDRTRAATSHGHVSADLLNRLPYGVIVFSESGKVLLANARGAPWVRRLLPPPVTSALDAQPVSTGGWRLSRPFTDVVRALLTPDAHRSIQGLQALGVDGREAQIVAMTLTPALYFSSTWQGRPLLATIHEPHTAPHPVPALLRDLYGLTPAENRLAMLLTTGIGLPDACLQLGIKRETSRSQLKSIFTKTNTSTQAQLAHLLTRLGSVLTEAAMHQPS